MVAQNTRPDDEITVAAPQQLRDRAAHRVADRDDRAGAELDQRRRAVVGAVGEAEDPAGADALAVAAQVGGDHVEVLAERLEGLEPVQPAARAPAVEEEEGRRASRTGHLPDEGGAPAGELEPATGREAGLGRRCPRPPRSRRRRL